MWLSMGTGTTDEFFSWGRDAAGLDFCAPANHYNWRYEVTEDIWRDLVDACNRWNEPGRFVTLVSYESAGGHGSGHRNVYFRGDNGAFDYWYRRPWGAEPLWEWLEECGWEAITIPHHPRTLGGTDWAHRNDRFQRLVEICSKWGISEEATVQARWPSRLGPGGTALWPGEPGSYHVNDSNGWPRVAEIRREHWRFYERRCTTATASCRPDSTAPDGRRRARQTWRPAPRVRMRVAGTHRRKA